MSCGLKFRRLALHLVIFSTLRQLRDRLADPTRRGRYTWLLENYLLARLGLRRFAHMQRFILVCLRFSGYSELGITTRLQPL